MEEFSKQTQGFFYDQQLEDPMLTVKLFPNTVRDGINWKQVSDPDDEQYEQGVEYKYSKTPLCRSLITDDFNVSIANTWTEFGGDPLSQVWNGQKAMAPYLKAFSQIFSTIAQKTADYDFSNSDLATSAFGKGNENQAGDLLTKFFTWTSKSQDVQSKLLNRSLVVQGTQFRYYGGTGTDFGNLSMKFTIFAGYDNNGVWKSVNDQLTKYNGSGGGLIDYAIGDYIALISKGDVTGNFDTTIGASATKFVNNFAQWQLPPGGFESAIKNVDVIQPGTLKLTIGPFYSITNLLIQSLNLNYSKVMVKNPSKWKDGGTCDPEPYSCDVTLNLTPATKYSKGSLTSFVQGVNSEKYRSKVSTQIRKALDEAKNLKK